MCNNVVFKISTKEAIYDLCCTRIGLYTCMALAREKPQYNFVTDSKNAESNS